MDRSALIDRYLEGIDVLVAAFDGLSEEQLDHVPADGGWTARQVAHHTADSEMTSAIRLRRLLAEDNPVIAGYDPDAFARDLHYDRRPIAASLAAVRAARESTASILATLTEAEWARAGTHTESGTYTMDDWLRIYSQHCHDHADQVRRAVG